MRDIDRIADGGSAIRFVIGEYGSGKTFFLYLIRSIALEKGLVAAHADLNPDRRLHATGGQARSLYAELMATSRRAPSPTGGAVASVVERFVTSALQEAPGERAAAEAVIQDRLGSLTELTGGYDFAEVIAAYWRGHDQGNEQLKSDAVRWLRGEFTTRTDARKALGVRIDRRRRQLLRPAQAHGPLRPARRLRRPAGLPGRDGQPLQAGQQPGARTPTTSRSCAS